MKLSLSMIVKDEAFFIEDSLAAARPYVDEIVVVDTGSEDGTREIAARLADQVVDFDWIGDFAAARNAGLACVTGDWVLVLDADERIRGADYEALRAGIADTPYDGFYLTARNYTDEQTTGWIQVAPDDPMAHGFTGYTTHEIMRLFRARDDLRYQGRVHEIVDSSLPEGARGHLSVPIHHYGHENTERPKQQRMLSYLRIMEEELAAGEDARLYFHAGNTLLRCTSDYTRAARYLRRAAELGYRGPEALESEAEASYRAGDFGPALELYEQVYTSGVKSPVICLNLANLKVRAGHRAEAVALLRECLDLGGLGPDLDETIRRNIAHLEA